MNAAELRYKVTQYLNGLAMPAAVESATLSPPVPGLPLTTEVTILDPYTPGRPLVRPSRRFKITFEELD